MSDVKTQDMTTAEAARELRVSEATVRRYVKNGDLDGHRVGPRLLRINPDSVRKLNGEG